MITLWWHRAGGEGYNNSIQHKNYISKHEHHRLLHLLTLRAHYFRLTPDLADPSWKGLSGCLSVISHSPSYCLCVCPQWNCFCGLVHIWADGGQGKGGKVCHPTFQLSPPPPPPPLLFTPCQCPVSTFLIHGTFPSGAVSDRRLKNYFSSHCEKIK